MLKKPTFQQLVAKKDLEEIDFKDISTDVQAMLTMSGELIVNNNKHEIVIYIDCNFPLVYPKFYLRKNLFLRYPHIERKNNFGCGICLEEEGQKRYHHNSSELLFYQIEKLKEFLLKMDNGELDTNDFIDEFESYWNENLGLSISINTDIFTESRIVDGVYIKKTSHVIVDSKLNMERFEKACNTQSQSIQILYLDLGVHFVKKIPRTYNEFFNIIKNAGHAKTIENLIINKTISPLLIFSFITESKQRFFAALKLEYFSAKKCKYGSYHIFTNKVQSSNLVMGYAVKTINKQRLFMRGGDETTQEVVKNNQHIVIVGCGSLGSTLAYKLAKSGISKFTLIDYQLLSSDNIGRHLLGLEYVGCNKAEAIKNYLEKQFIHCDIQAIPKTAESSLNELKNVNLFIVALGSDAPHVEEYLIEQSMQGIIAPSITCWFEANAISGHAILFDENTDLKHNTLSMIFEKINILDAMYTSSFLKHDAGCNATYMPYSFIDADLHINHFSHMILGYLLGKETKSILSSIGQVKPEYILKNDHKKENYVLKMAMEDICVD